HVLEIFDHAAEQIDAYKITLSDGQTITADSNHQFVVSDLRARNYRSSAKHIAGVQRRQRLMGQVEQLRELAVAFTDEQLVDNKDLAKAVAQIDADGIFANPETVRESLRMVDVEDVARGDTEPALGRGFTAQHEQKDYDVRRLLEQCIEDWSEPIRLHEAKNQQWKDAIDRLAENHTDQLISSRKLRDGLVAAGSPLGARFIADSVTQVALDHGVWHDGGKAPKPRYYMTDEILGLLRQVPIAHRGHPFKVDEISAAQAVVQIGGRSHLAGIAAMMMDSGAPGLKKSIAADLGKVVKKHKIASCVESVDIVNDERISHFGSAYLYPKRTAILGLSIRLAQIAQGTLLRTADDDEEVLSVGEVRGRGLTAPNAGSQFAIRVSKPVQGTDRDVPMDPYVFGIWLGDGQTAGGRSLANPDVEILDRIEAAGYKVERGTFDKVTDPDQWCTHQVTNWSQDLQATGAVGDKHIPISYATAS